MRAMGGRICDVVADFRIWLAEICSYQVVDSGIKAMVPLGSAWQGGWQVGGSRKTLTKHANSKFQM